MTTRVHFIVTEDAVFPCVYAESVIQTVTKSIGKTREEVVQVDVRPKTLDQEKDLNKWEIFFMGPAEPWATEEAIVPRIRAALHKFAQDRKWFVKASGHAVKVGYGGQATSTGDGTAIAGDHGTAKSGLNGLSLVGDFGYAKAGDVGTAEGGDFSRALAGDMGRSESRFHGMSFTEAYGTSISGDDGFSVAGFQGTAITGDRGVARVGCEGTCVVGRDGQARVGYEGRARGKQGANMHFHWRADVESGKSNCFFLCDSGDRFTTVVVGYDGIEPDVFYCVDDEGNIIRAEDQD